MKKVLGFLLYALAVALGFFATALNLIHSDDLGNLLNGIIFIVYIIPPILLVLSIIYGIFRGFNILIPIITAGIALLFMLYVNPESVIDSETFVLPLIAAVISLLGNGIGRIFYKKKS